MDVNARIIKAPQRLGGSVRLPSSKSICNRALVISRLSGADPLKNVLNISDCDDSQVVCRAFQNPTERVIDIMAAGTAMRFLTAMLTVTEGTHIITGTERMKHRPISILVDALRTLGADVEYVENEGFPPLQITGKTLEGGEISLPGNVSSQYISALLMIAPTLSRGLYLQLTGDIISRPYIDMTLSIMREFGAKAEWTSQNTITVRPTGYNPVEYRVESDWSAASYWYEMVALSDDADIQIQLPGLFQDSLQGDSKIAELFLKLGVKTQYVDREQGVILTKCPITAERLDIDMVTMPDMAQTVVVTCCMMGIPFHITGLQSLKIKETDRIVALQQELKKLGLVLESRNDSELLYTPVATPCADSETAIDTYEDHRMAMSFAPAALKLGQIAINNPQVVSKSYPTFWEDLHQLTTGC